MKGGDKYPSLSGLSKEDAYKKGKEAAESDNRTTAQKKRDLGSQFRSYDIEYRYWDEPSNDNEKEFERGYRDVMKEQRTFSTERYSSAVAPTYSFAAPAPVPASASTTVSTASSAEDEDPKNVEGGRKHRKTRKHKRHTKKSRKHRK